MTNETKPEGQPTSAPETPAATATGPADAAAVTEAAAPEAATTAAAQASGAASGQSSGQASGTMTLAVAEAAIGVLQSEIAELKDRLLRTHADMDNIRKRSEKEKADAHKYAVSKFARDMIEVGDNFQRAIETVPAGAAEQNPALKSFLDGVTMTERELINTLERHGIKRIDPKGQIFNPHLHQAVMEAQNLEVPAGTVTQVYQLGYMIDDRVLRPAMVVVAKGGFKPMRPVEAPDPAAPSGGGQG